MQVQRAAWTTAAATVRICQLAQPKRKPALEGLGPTPKAPTTAYKASAHTELLAGESTQPLSEILRCLSVAF